MKKKKKQPKKKQPINPLDCQGITLGDRFTKGKISTQYEPELPMHGLGDLGKL